MNLWLKIVLQNKHVPLSRKHWNLIIHPYAEPRQFIIPSWGYFSKLEIVAFSCLPDPKKQNTILTQPLPNCKVKNHDLYSTANIVIAEKHNTTMILIQTTILPNGIRHEIQCFPNCSSVNTINIQNLGWFLCLPQLFPCKVASKAQFSTTKSQSLHYQLVRFYQQASSYSIDYCLRSC